MRAYACCPKRMTKSWRTCAEELCVYEYIWVYILSSSLFQESEESHSVSPEINGQPVGKIPSSGHLVCWMREMFNEVSALSICRKFNLWVLNWAWVNLWVCNFPWRRMKHQSSHRIKTIHTKVNCFLSHRWIILTQLNDQHPSNGSFTTNDVLCSPWFKLQMTHLAPMLGTTNCPHQFLHSQWNSQDTNVTKNGWKSSSKNSTGRQHGLIFGHKYGVKLPNHSISFNHLSGNGGSLSPSKQQVVYSLYVLIPKKCLLVGS